MSWSTLSLQGELPDDAVCECSNCEWEGPPSEVEDLKDPNERLYPGEIVPAGECPKCGCTAHVKEKVKTPAELFEEFVVAIRALKDAGWTEKDFDAGLAKEAKGKNRLKGMM